MSRFPFSFANGWYRALYSDELGVGEVKAPLHRVEKCVIDAFWCVLEQGFCLVNAMLKEVVTCNTRTQFAAGGLAFNR